MWNGVSFPMCSACSCRSVASTARTRLVYMSVRAPPRAQREDGIVTIDYDLCIGCSYCTVACPYQARYKVDKPEFAYGDMPTETEAKRFDERTLGVAQKCTFCSDRVDAGVEQGLTPGIDPEATPGCVNACIADALSFGDIEDENSNVSELLAENTWFQMHAELGTEPGFYYLWDADDTRRRTEAINIDVQDGQD